MLLVPTRRLWPVAMVVLPALVLSCAQRMALFSLVRADVRADWLMGARVLVTGTSADLAGWLIVTLPFAAWCLLAPERWWRAKLHRSFIMLVASLGVLAAGAFLLADALYFHAHRMRLGPGARSRLMAILERPGESEAGNVLLLALAASVALALLVLLALAQPMLERTWDAASTGRARLRDGALLVVASLALAAISFVRAPAFDVRELEQLSRNALLPVVRAVVW